jgi:hypothetical protein
MIEPVRSSNAGYCCISKPLWFWSARQWRSRLARARRGKDDNNNTNNTNNTNNRIGPPKSWVASASRPKHSTKHYPARQWPGLEYEKRCEIRRHFGTISAAKNRRCGDSSLTLCMVVLQRQWSHHPIVKTHTEENMSSKKWRENKKSFEKQMERGTTRGPRLAHGAERAVRNFLHQVRHRPLP